MALIIPQPQAANILLAAADSVLATAPSKDLAAAVIAGNAVAFGIALALEAPEWAEALQVSIYGGVGEEIRVDTALRFVRAHPIEIPPNPHA